jgi:carbamoylphosphate synthase large subunit
VLHIVEKEKPDGVIVQFGGQTPLNLSTPLHQEGVPILGTQPESIDRAEDRELFQAMLNKLNLMQPANGTALTIADALAIADTIGYPVIVRPSFVLGGRAMKIVYDPKDMETFTRLAILASPGHPGAHRQVSGGGGGSGCGRHLRRDHQHHRRYHGTHRGRRGPQRRLRLCPASHQHRQ